MFDGRNLDYQWEEVFATVIEAFDSKGVVSEIRTSWALRRIRLTGPSGGRYIPSTPLSSQNGYSVNIRLLSASNPGLVSSTALGAQLQAQETPSNN